MEKHKEKLLNNLISHIDFIRGRIKQSLERVEILANKSIREISRMRPEDQLVQMQLKANAENRIIELNNLDSSPYFFKCYIKDEEGIDKEYYFSKHQFSEESIYSWVAPVASIRFENLGDVSYQLIDGTKKNIYVKKKEQYMIVDGKVIFFALEEKDKLRELIYQEHFTRQKTEFALPEIIAQMEKAQDQVIRAHHKGPLVISGPAGSGKTTLALHRVAYLTQAPDTAEIYKANSIIVFVQDNGTKEYFEKLLPGLGIKDIKITTFGEWALYTLNLIGYSYIERCGDNEEEKDMYEYQKLRALRENSIIKWNSNIYRVLYSIYKDYFSDDNNKIFDKQKKEKKLDRFDLSILLKSYFEKFNKFETKREYQTFVKGNLVKRIEKNKVEYRLIIIDEFQNYLREQLQIFRNCLNDNTTSTVYVGDIAQQIKLGTIRSLEDIGEKIEHDRNIVLNKVYRNTKNILLFIESLGYKIKIPLGLKIGPVVLEKEFQTIENEIEYIKNNIAGYEKGTIGVILKNDTLLSQYKDQFKNINNIHVMTMTESQGVEFDIVFIVGIDISLFEVASHYDILPEHINERKRMQKDLLYVALTRAITELHILGKEKLSNIFGKI